jgi:hypothetical protein
MPFDFEPGRRGRGGAVDRLATMERCATRLGRDLAWGEIIELWQLADRIDGTDFATMLELEFDAATDRDAVIIAVQQATLARRPAMTWHQYQLVWNAVTGEMGREDYLVGQVSVGGEDRSEKPR